MNTNRRTSLVLSVCLALLAAILTTPAQAVIVVDDDWADGSLLKTGTLDSNWWTSSSTSAIEVNTPTTPGMGLVTGNSGRGIHTIFPTQTLANVGDSLTATYMFKTPATIAGSAQNGAFRIGLFDNLGRTGLNANVNASSASPNSLFGWGTAVQASGGGPFGPGTAGLPGYMMDLDVGPGSEGDISFRQHDTGTVNPTGRLMATTAAFASISNGDDGEYSIAANTTYTGSIKVIRLNATQLEITGTLGSASYTATDTFDSASFGMLAFHANSNIFGSSGTAGQANNGIDFSRVTIEFTPVPEPSAFLLVGLVCGVAYYVKRKQAKVSSVSL